MKNSILKTVTFAIFSFLTFINYCFANSKIGCDSIRECLLIAIINYGWYGWIIIGIPVVISFIFANLFLDFSGKVKEKDRNKLRLLALILNLIIFIGGAILINGFARVSLYDVHFIEHWGYVDTMEVVSILKIFSFIGGIGLISLLAGELYYLINYNNNLKQERGKKLLIYSGLISILSIIAFELIKKHYLF